MASYRDIIYNYENDCQQKKWLNNHVSCKTQGVVLMFHHVTDDTVDTIPGCYCGTEEFRSILNAYINEGFKFVTIEQALDIAKNDLDEKFAVVTFDDIPDNVFTNAYPYLLEKKIPFTIFVTVDYVDVESYITKEHLAILSKDPLCTIGAHTMTHPKLRCSRNYKWEINESKRRLEGIIGTAVNYMAYPYGKRSSVSDSVIRCTKEAGYRCAFSTISAYLDRESVEDMFILPRIVPLLDNIPPIFKTSTPFLTALKSIVYTFLHSLHLR